MTVEPRPDWFRARGYPHFDKPISLTKATALVTSPSRVAKHSFFPFISFTVISKKVMKDSSTGKATFKPPKERQISYASHLDSLIYGYYSDKLAALYESALSESGLENEIIAFRSVNKKSNIEFANDAFEEIRRRGNCSVIALDISKFFDTLDHSLLKAAWKSILKCSALPEDHYAVFKSLTKYAYVVRDELIAALEIPKTAEITCWEGLCTADQFREKVRNKALIKRNLDSKGIPQGSPISALLSNIYMLDFDRALMAEIDDIGGKYYRYCDDMLIIVDHNFENDVEKHVVELIKKYKLEVNAAKTETTTFIKSASGLLTTKQKKPMQYLGFTFDGERKLIRSAGFARFSNKMKRGVSLAKQTARKHNKIRQRKGRAPQEIYRRSLYERYSHLGERNFLTYGLRAAEIMKSDSIRKQLKPWWSRLQAEVRDAEQEIL